MRGARKRAKVRWQTVVLMLALLALLAAVMSGSLEFPARRTAKPASGGWYQLSPAERLKALGGGLRR